MKKRLRAVLIDDERLARKDLRSLLTEHDNVEIVGEADSVTSAAKLIEETDPDLLFLDIQMPGESGFDLLEKAEVRGNVIFVTAFDEYAIRAFEIDAVDYLLKPVNPDRLQTAIERAVKEGPQRSVPRKNLEYDDSLFLTINNRLKFLKVSSIAVIQAAGDYSDLTTHEGKKGLVLKPLGEWEERLPEKHFCRIHRSTVVNMEFIERVEPWGKNSYHVHLIGIASPLEMSRRYAAALKQKMG
ncbi:MAG: response regulator transcription factor [Ignavibacteria bacterium]|nr:response regulator transcription factor [Ignavibacteria bacterium]